MKYQKVNAREFQHNISKYMLLATESPIILTKHGKNEVVLLDLNKFDITPKPNTNNNVLDSKFIGMHKNTKDYKNKPSVKIASKLRENAWYGK